MGKREHGRSFSVKKMFQNRLERKKEKFYGGGGSFGKRKLYFKGNLKCNLPGLINKKGNKDKGELAKIKVRTVKILL